MTLKEFIIKLKRRIIWAVKGRPVQIPLLEMVWPQTKRDGPLVSDMPAGYRVRQFEENDRENYYQLFNLAGMEKPPLDYWEKHLLPGGFFVVDHLQSGSMVAACFASHHPAARHPCAGNLGWLAVDPAHRGLGLGRVVAAEVATRLLAGGYERIYLETHDHRLAAIAIYLKMGWLPLLYLPEMPKRWEAVCQALNWPFTPECWPSQETGQGQ